MTQPEALVGASLEVCGVLPAGWRVIARYAVGSTNDEAREHAKAGAPEGTLVWALRQTAGRGRRGRGWDSPEGNLYVSVILRPEATTGFAAQAAQASFVAAVAVADLVRGLLPPMARVQVKWPNDVLVNGRKVCGLLLEAEPETDGRVLWLVIGIGLNLQFAPTVAQYPATSLRAAGGDGVLTPGVVLPVLAKCLASAVDDWRQNGFAGMCARWRAQAIGIGAPVTVRLANDLRVGIFRDLDADGALILELADGQRQRITAGDVFFAPTSVPAVAVPTCAVADVTMATEMAATEMASEVIPCC